MSAMIEELAKKAKEADAAIVRGDYPHKYHLGDEVYYPVLNNTTTTIAKGKIVVVSIFADGGINYSISTDGNIVVMPERFVSDNAEKGANDVLLAYYTHTFRCMVKEMLDSGLNGEDVKNIIISASTMGACQ